MTNLEGAVVLVVGASGGLGSRIAAQLEAAGSTVVRASRSGSVDGPAEDLREPAAAAALVSAALAAHGRLDGVVIAAGVVAFGPASEDSDTTLDDLFAINTLGPIRLIRESFAPLTESAQAGGKPFIVTLTGIVSEVPTAGLAAYSAAKSGLAAFMVAASREFRRSGIRLMDARPGHIDTQLSQHPISGTAPQFGAALNPDAVAARVVQAIRDDEKDLPSTAF
jgi:NAD(P)-dependent dehydrogenase (short-subunit alcohol dehydrogenase family)